MRYLMSAIAILLSAQLFGTANAQESYYSVSRVGNTGTTTTFALNHINPANGQVTSSRNFTIQDDGGSLLVGNPIIDAQNGQIVVRTQSPGVGELIHTVNLNNGKLVSSITSPAFNGELAALYSAPSSTATSANTAAIASHDARISSLEDKTDLLSYRIEELDDKIGRVGAMAAALNIQRPIDGKKFRVGMDVGFYDGKAAVGIAGSTVAGNVDIGGGVAFTGGEVMGKAGVGFSW